jgi:hypothetical protein
MALYAFDGTGNIDQEDDSKDTNVVRFKELYNGNGNPVYLPGVGTRFGAIGRALGGLLGAGGRSRISEMYDELCENWANGDKQIDIVGFSRGAALAVHFTNKIADQGIELPNGQTDKAEIRFLGLWDVVGSFGLSFDTFINFQEINLGWDIDTVQSSVKHCYHAMALDERRETFNLTRLDPEHQFDHINELWFKGVHSDIGGGNENIKRSNIALQWILDMARQSGVPLKESMALEEKYITTDLAAPISENQDLQRDPRRTILAGDRLHQSAQSQLLSVNQSHTITVLSKLKYNWAGIQLEKGNVYQFSCKPGDTWLDGDIECGAQGWDTEQLPGFKEFVVERFEQHRRVPDANWFELIGALGDEDDNLFRISDDSDHYTAQMDAELYLFANDLQNKYSNNEGALEVTIKRIS